MTGEHMFAIMADRKAPRELETPGCTAGRKEPPDMSESTTPERKVTRIPPVDPEQVRARDLKPWDTRKLRGGKWAGGRPMAGVGSSGTGDDHLTPWYVSNLLRISAAEASDKAAHIKAYERAFGPVPQHVHVHHKDGDHGNNHPANLCILSPSQHSALHWRIRKGLEQYSDEGAIERIRESHPDRPVSIVPDLRRLAFSDNEE